VTDVDTNRTLRCSKCGEEKPDEGFHRNKSRTYRRGRNDWCKPCATAASSKWQAENRERKAQYDARHRVANWGAIRKRESAYFAAHRAERMEQTKRWQAENRDLVREYGRRSSQASGESGLRRSKEAHLRHMYQLDPHEYIRMCEQGCHRCGTDEPGGKHGVFEVDHDHSCCEGAKSCGACVRGTLCRKCNVDVMHIERVLEMIPAAVIPDAYLDRWEREGQWWRNQT